MKKFLCRQKHCQSSVLFSYGYWVHSGQRDEANVGCIAQNQGGAAQRRRGRSQAEGWVDGVQRIPPLAASVEWRAGSSHGLADALPWATSRGWRFCGRCCRAGNLQVQRGGLWGARRAQGMRVVGVDHPLQHVLGALSALWGEEEIEMSRNGQHECVL